MTLRTIAPREAQRLMEEGAILVDVREAAEHARERIPGARHVALSKLDEADFAAHRGQTVLLHCRSGARTRSHGARLAAKMADGCEAYVVEGGIDAWRRQGLPTIVDRPAAIERQRRVQIAAGILTVAGVLLGLNLSPWFFAVPVFAGAGLLVAGAAR